MPDDTYIKRTLHIRHYHRYADDFVILGTGPEELASYLEKIQYFLKEHLKLELHPNKISLLPLAQGFDFLGYIILPHHRQVRTITKRRMFKKLSQLEATREEGDCDLENPTLSSYLGHISHADSYHFSQEIRNTFSGLGVVRKIRRRSQ